MSYARTILKCKGPGNRQRTNRLLTGLSSMIIMGIAILAPAAVFADKLTIRSLYTPVSVWKTSFDGNMFGVFDFTQKDAYTVQDGYGLGIEYEYRPTQARFGFAGGIDYYFPRAIPDVKQTFRIPVIEVDETMDRSLYNMSYQVSTIYLKVKGYINDAWYIGAMYQSSTPKLVGKGWEDWFGSDASIKSASGFGLALGAAVEDLSVELSLLQDTLKFVNLPTTMGNGDTLEIEQSTNDMACRLTLAVGYSFNMSMTFGPREPLDNKDTEKTREELKQELREELKQEMQTELVATPAPVFEKMTIPTKAPNTAPTFPTSSAEVNIW